MSVVANPPAWKNAHRRPLTAALGRRLSLSIQYIITYIHSPHLIQIIRAIRRNIIPIRKRLDGKRPRLLDEFRPTVLTLRVGRSSSTSPFDICHIMRFTHQRLHPRAMVRFAPSAPGRAVEREKVASTARGSGSGSGGLVVAAAAAHVVAADEAGFDAVEEGLEVEEAGGGYAQALDDLGADGRGPVVEGGVGWGWGEVPEDELACAGCDDSVVVELAGERARGRD